MKTMDNQGNATRRIVVFSDDWDRHPSSCQHLIRHLLDEIPVVWVNTIGTRRPSLSPYTLRRSLGKLRQWLGSNPSADPDPRRSSANPTVASPLMWPSFHSSWGRSLNKKLLLKQLQQFTESSGDVVAVTTLPIVADLIGEIDFDRWVYYCVDDLSQWPGLDSKPLEAMERVLLERVDQVVAASESLATRLDDLGRGSTLLTHGIDLDFWSGSHTSDELAPPLAEPPYVVFWGVVDRRLDLSFLRTLSRRLSAGSILLIGPHNDPDPGLAQLENVHLLGARKFEDLPAVARRASVMIMPYAQIPVNQVLQPLKFKEYLATGNPTVVSALPAVEPWSDCCDVAVDADHFSSLVLERLEKGTPSAQSKARERLDQETWETKARIFARVLFAS